MKIYDDISLCAFKPWASATYTLCDFKPWAGASYTFAQIKDAGKLPDLEYMLEEVYPDGMNATALNDLFWFETETLAEWLDMPELDLDYEPEEDT